MIEPFRIEVEESVLVDLRERLAKTRFPDQIEGTSWEYGTPVPYLRELVQYWLDEYDWRAAEAKLNRLDHFRTEIDGQSIHFVHARAAADDALPILVIHGWPGSIVEFEDVIPRLADDFHVVAPSLPGYGFSEPTRTPGWDPTRMAQAFIELMARLGYDRYGVQGGDWGSQVGTRIAVLDPDHCVALHLNMAIARR
ncbi:MAG: epoxide hydrolase, partial [Acidimicrobiales bacterium]